MKISSRIEAVKYKTMYNVLNYMNKNNQACNSYREEGLKLLEGKVDKLPDKIAFRPKFIKQSFCVKIFNEIYIFISKANLSKPQESKFDALFHEVGHWFNFQNLPPKSERMRIWAGADKERIKEEVSEYSITKDDGLELVPEVFKGLVKGKIFSDYITKLYDVLGGPRVK